MSLIVEDGTGLANAESYVSVANATTYANNRGLTFGLDVPTSEQALRRATAYIDQMYRLRFDGFRTNRRAQSLEWPRMQAYYYTPDSNRPTPYFIDPRQAYPYDLIPSNSVPIEIVNGTCEAAVREYAEPGVLFPDLERGGGVASLKAGSVEIRYGGNATANTVFQAIEAALSGLVGPRNQFSAQAARV